MTDRDQILKKYVDILQSVYDGDTAGDYTFAGILYEFVHELDDLEQTTKLENFKDQVQKNLISDE